MISEIYITIELFAASPLHAKRNVIYTIQQQSLPTKGNPRSLPAAANHFPIANRGQQKIKQKKISLNQIIVNLPIEKLNKTRFPK